MTRPSARVICDSVSPQGKRLTTFEVTFHRFILAEANTHRVLSRNYRSSRAVPSVRLIEEVRADPATPVHWGANRPGMQAAEELSDLGNWTGPVYDLSPRDEAKNAWLVGAREAANRAEVLAKTGLHKQVANRVLEPFLWVHGVVTATEWDNFFGLRLDRDAQPEFRALAEAMWRAKEHSVPSPLTAEQWHLPYVETTVTEDEACRWRARTIGTGQPDLGAVDLSIRQSVARCARVSYRPFDADRPSTLEEDLTLYDRLVSSRHWSPLEHQATPDNVVGTCLIGDSIRTVIDGFDVSRTEHRQEPIWGNRNEWGNLVGWRQYRKMIPGEDVAPLPEEFA